jgi:hypothetical protein
LQNNENKTFSNPYFAPHIYAVHSQDKEEYTLLLVDKDTKNIVVSFSKDTTSISLGIYKPGFETEEARKQKLLEYNKKYRPFARANELSHVFNFRTIKEPERLVTLPNNENFVDIEIFRHKQDFSKKIYFIYKVNDNCYLKWKLVQLLGR